MCKPGTCAAWVRTAATTLNLLFLILATPLQAADAPLDKLSLADAVQAALSVNPNLKEARYDYQTSLSRLRVAGFDTQYGVTGVTNLERNDADSGLSSGILGNFTYRNLLGTEASLDVAPFGFGENRGAVSLTLRQPLTQGRGALSTKANLVEGARISAGVEDKQLFLTTQATALGVVSAYHRATLARDLVKVQEKAVAIAEQAAYGAHKRMTEGLVAEIEVSRADIRLAQTRDDLNRQHQAARAALDRLMISIGAGVGQNPELTDEIPWEDVELPALVDAVEIALKNRSELAVYDLRLSDQERRLAVTKDRLRPAFDAFAGLNYRNDDPGVISSSVVTKGDLTAGVEIRFPLDKRVSIEERDTAEQGLDVLKNLRTYQMEQIAEQVRNSYRSVESARSSVDILSRNLEVAEQNRSLAERMVDEGLTSNRDLLDAQESLTRVESGLLRARMDLYLAAMDLKYAMGEDLTYMGTK